MNAFLDGDGRRTRRAFIRQGAGTVGGLTAASLGIDPVAATATPTVMTQNMYLGVDLGRLFDARSLADVRTIAGDMLEEVDPSTEEARVDAMAAAVEATEADVVALQEAALLRTQRPGDFGTDDPTAAEAVVVDLLDMLDSALEDRGLDYDIAVTTVTTDVELPAETPDGPADVRITDRDVLLVRGDHDTRETVTTTYTAAIPLPIPGTTDILELQRGYCAAEVVVDGVPFTAVSTHLESIDTGDINLGATDGGIRAQQAEELLDDLATTGPVVLCGDFNSGPQTNPETYDLLTETFDDAHAAVGETEGVTCCQPASLEADQPRFGSRLDLLLYRGGVRPVDVRRVGHRPADRVTVQRNGEDVQLWPSDHAGVVATLEVPEPTPTPSATPHPPSTPTPTPDSTPTPADTSTPSPTPGESGPGFGVVAALAGAVGVGLAGVGRLVRSDE